MKKESELTAGEDQSPRQSTNIRFGSSHLNPYRLCTSVLTVSMGSHGLCKMDPSISRAESCVPPTSTVACNTSQRD